MQSLSRPAPQGLASRCLGASRGCAPALASARAGLRARIGTSGIWMCQCIFLYTCRYYGTKKCICMHQAATQEGDPTDSNKPQVIPSGFSLLQVGIYQESGTQSFKEQKVRDLGLQSPQLCFFSPCVVRFYVGSSRFKCHHGSTWGLVLF